MQVHRNSKFDFFKAEGENSHVPELEDKLQPQEIESPDGAVFKAEQELFDAALGPDAAVIATVHKIKGGSAGNVWERNDHGTQKILPQRNLDSEPNVNILVGEVTRLARNLSESQRSEMRINLPIRGLLASAVSQAKKSS